jgi:hypothetical protein
MLLPLRPQPTRSARTPAFKFVTRSLKRRNAPASPRGSWQRQLSKSRCEGRRSRVESLLLERSRDSTPSSLTSALALRASQGPRVFDRYTAAKEMGRGGGGVGGGRWQGLPFRHLCTRRSTHAHTHTCSYTGTCASTVTSTRTPMPMYLCLCIRAHVRKNIYPPPSAVPLFLSPPVHFRWHIFAFIREGQWTPSTSKIEEKRNFFCLEFLHLDVALI